MFRWTVTVALVAVLCVSLSTVTATAAGELRDGASLVSGMVGWSNYQSQLSGDRVNGASWSFDYARTADDAQWSAGFVLRRFESDQNFEAETSGEETRVNSKRLVAAVRGTFYLRQGQFNPYVSMLLGVHMQTSDVYSTAAEDYRQSSQTLATGFSAGTNFHLTEGIYLRAEYTLHYFAKSDLIENNLMHGLYGGIGFQFGGH